MRSPSLLNLGRVMSKVPLPGRIKWLGPDSSSEILPHIPVISIPAMPSARESAQLLLPVRDTGGVLIFWMLVEIAPGITPGDGGSVADPPIILISNDQSRSTVALVMVLDPVLLR